MFSRKKITESTENYWDNIKKLKKVLEKTKAIVIGAGAGLSTSAGFTYSGERFERYFHDFSKKYGFYDMYSGGFYPYKTPGEFWAFWSRYIFVNRYMEPPKPIYENLLKIVNDKDYFVITTNVDHLFQKAGFDKSRLFYTQGDYGLFQCSVPCHKKTYDNKETMIKMVEAQGFLLSENGGLVLPSGLDAKMNVPEKLFPKCPVCGKPLTMNLRSDDSFVEDEGWHEAAKRYADFLENHSGGILFLELGVGYNTPGIIKVPFWKMTVKNPEAAYVCINIGDTVCPDTIKKKSLCIKGDIGNVLNGLI